MKNKEIEELLKGMRDVSNTDGACMNLDRYLVKLLLSYIEQLENNRDKAIEVIDLITPELWNISNAMTYKLKDIKIILKGDSDDK